jgi:hypothetical protein
MSDDEEMAALRRSRVYGQHASQFGDRSVVKQQREQAELEWEQEEERRRLAAPVTNCFQADVDDDDDNAAEEDASLNAARSSVGAATPSGETGLPTNDTAPAPAVTVAVLAATTAPAAASSYVPAPPPATAPAAAPVDVTPVSSIPEKSDGGEDLRALFPMSFELGPAKSRCV